MDHLWFHHTILLPEPTSLILSKTLKPASLNLSLHEVEGTPSPLEEEEEESRDSSPMSAQLDDAYNNGEEDKDTNLQQRPTRLNLTRGKSNRSQSSSPATLKRLKKRRYSKSLQQKSKSCRSLMELELEEVKGFMDLGFRFNKECLSPRMMSVLPGLQRVKLHQVARDGDDDDETDQQDDEDYEKRVMRPYLSEAWLIKRPDSPLLNFRMPRVTAAADDMKKHLRFWAKTVASEIQQEC